MKHDRAVDEVEKMRTSLGSRSEAAGKNKEN